MTVQERVANGVAWLNEVKPGWEELVDVKTLRIDSPDNCICGQVFKEEALARRVGDGYSYVFHLLNLPVSLTRLGFTGTEVITAEWRRVLTEIRVTSKTPALVGA